MAGWAREFRQEFGCSIAYVEIEDPSGNIGIGSAFHVGEGIYVTARHVVEGNRILRVSSTESGYVDLDESESDSARTFLQIGDVRKPVHNVYNSELTIDSGPYFHPDSRVDVAAIKVNNWDRMTPVLLLGSHLDDWLDTSLVLSEAVVLGYPPIPMTSAPILAAAHAEINAIVDLRSSPHAHFVLSTIPRGGFSGGVAYSEYGFVLGVITESLIRDSGSPETGFFAVIGVEPIYECLARHKILPAQQAEMWDGLWDLDSEPAEGY